MKKPPYHRIRGVKIPSLKLIALSPDLVDVSRRVSPIVSFMYDEADLDAKLAKADVDSIRDGISKFDEIVDRLTYFEEPDSDLD